MGSKKYFEIQKEGDGTYDLKAAPLNKDLRNQYMRELSLFGYLIMESISEGVHVPLKFRDWVYKKIMHNSKATLDDYKTYDIHGYNGMMAMKNYNDEELQYVDESLTRDNIDEYIVNEINERLMRVDEWEAFISGLLVFIDFDQTFETYFAQNGKIPPLSFLHDTLETKILIEIDDWKKHTRLSNCGPDDKQVEYFWQVISDDFMN
ncbi:hypothetical protein O9G_004836 [Rozella allomycis CSF55]|uniref:HECT domain-containing protein n=1 Tax=Rozella allomycis (strain CSF55) TaxID=988480 RepID=A0A075AYC3_ROZAC|nr:hypothetical protein O9G_004836 [Rozella allomycis CSF55]|eukprot:EPZ35089.1 hypothetical protein O9G_004836 [Rozella allomycis CSF55]